MAETTVTEHLERLLKHADFFYRSGQNQKANEAYWAALEIGVDDETKQAIEVRLNEIAARTGATVPTAVAEDGEGPGVGPFLYTLACLGQCGMVALCAWQAIRAITKHGIRGAIEPLVAVALFVAVFFGLLSMRGRAVGWWRRLGAATNVLTGGIAASALLWLAPQIDVTVREPSRDGVLTLVAVLAFGVTVICTHKALRASEVFDAPGWLKWATPAAAVAAVVSDASFRLWVSLRFGGNSPEQMFAHALQAAMTASQGGMRTDLLLVAIWLPLAVAGLVRGR